MAVKLTLEMSVNSYRLGERYRNKLQGPQVLLKGQPLTVRAADIHFLGQLGLEADCKVAQMFFADIAAARSGDLTAVNKIRSFLRQVRLQDQRITLKQGRYRNLGGCENNPRHDVILHRPFELTPLTMGLLREFSTHPTVRSIIDRRYNKDKKDSEMVREISVVDVLEILEFINPALISEKVRLRLPSEAVIEAFLSSLRHRMTRRGMQFLLTASRHEKERAGVDAQALEIEIGKENISEGDEFVVRTETNPAGRMMKSPENYSHVNGALLEVVPLNRSLISALLRNNADITLA